ncbi:MAG: hypothetical protein AAF384_17445 [Pseudomonadota bacterium]
MRTSYTLVAACLIVLANVASAGTIGLGTLNFKAENQSMWGSGPGLVPSSVNYSFSWNESTRFGGIAGSANEVITPSYTQSVWNPFKSGCNLVTGSGCYDSVTIDAVTADTRTGFEATLRTTGGFGLKTNLGANGGTVDAEVSYDTTISAPDNLAVGQFFSLNGGTSVEKAKLVTTAPTIQGQLEASMAFNVTGSSKTCVAFAGCSETNSNGPGINTGDLDILKLNTIDLPPDSASVFGLDNLAFDATKTTVWADLDGVSGLILSFPGSGLFVPPPVAAINLMQTDIDLPGRASANGSSSDGGAISSDVTFENVIKMDLDLDAAAAFAGVGLPGGAATSLGPVTFRGDLLDLDLGPTIDFNQQFNFTPNLMVDLEFDAPIAMRTSPGGELVCQDPRLTLINGQCGSYQTTTLVPGQRVCVPLVGCTEIPPITRTEFVAVEPAILTEPTFVEVTSFTGRWDLLPEFALLDENSVKITPTFWLDAQLANETTLGYDLNFSLDLLKGRISALGLTAVDTCFLCQDFEVADLGSFDTFDDSFAFGGFDRITTDPFRIGTNNALAYMLVPEPRPLALFAVAGVLLMASLRRQFSGNR